MISKSKNKTTFRWGMIGCGNVTELKSAPAYKLVDGFEINAVMRRDLEKLKDYAKRHQIKKYYTDADALINDPDIDAVYIATPPDSHLAYALKVAEAGKPCCIEKPLAPNYNDSLKIEQVFFQKNIPLFVAYYRRSLPRFKQIKTWLENQHIGTIRHVNWQLTKAPNDLDISRTYNWRTDCSIAPGGYFDDLASHGIDLIIYLLGNIKEVKGTSTNQQKLYKAKDAIAACWIHKNGITGVGSWNFGHYKREDRLEIIGSKGKISCAVFAEEPLILETLDNRQELFIENPPNIQLHHVENMKKQLIDENVVHPSNGKTATHTSWVMDKILGKIV